MSKARSTKKRQVDFESEDEDDERVLFFIPSADINIEVLVFYLKHFLGHDSDAEPGVHPRKRDVDGYFIRARLGLSTVMVEDLKRDSEDWKGEKRRKRSRLNYADSATAAQRLELGPSGRPFIPRATQELAAARRAAPTQPSSPPAQHTPPLPTTGEQHTMTLPPVGERHAQNKVPPDSIPVPEPDLLPNVLQHNRVISAQQSSYRYSSFADPGGAARPTLEYNVNVNLAAYPSRQQFPQRHESFESRPPEYVLPSIEGRSEYHTPAPPYEETEDKPEQPEQPSSTGTHGFPSLYPTAGSRHDRN